MPLHFNYLIFVSILSFLIGFASCKADNPAVQNNLNIQINVEDNNTMSNRMIIKIGSNIFAATLFDNATIAAFKAMLPMTIKMSELNGNEKYFHLSTNLPANSSNPEIIHTGDLMLWGSNSLVLFYQTLSTSYSYRRLGRIENTMGLAAAVGSGSVTVTFESE